jgi:hypothetical protein
MIMTRSKSRSDLLPGTLHMLGEEISDFDRVVLAINRVMKRA